MVVVFTGGRDFQDEKLFRSVRSLIGLEARIFVGDCPTGLDALVRNYYQFVKVFKADWQAHGRAAGPMRNRDMLTAAQAEAMRRHESLFLISFPGGRGTEDCTRQAHDLGIPVLRLEP